jgi:hypothetical protein
VTGNEAPSFPSGTGWKSARYPLGGAKTAGAWRAMWQAMAGLPAGEWAESGALAEVGMRAAACSVETARVLLTRAANAGVLEREYRMTAGRRRVFYRQASHAYLWIVAALADGKYRSIALSGAPGTEYLEELVQRGALERRWEGRSLYRLTWKPPAR